MGSVGVATLPGEVLIRSHLTRGPTPFNFLQLYCVFFKKRVSIETHVQTQESLRGRRAEPAVVPTRGHLDSIRRLMLGDVYIGRGARERDVPKSIWGNPFKVAKYGRRMAIDEYAKTLVADGGLHTRIWTISGCRLVCHCTPNQA